MGFFDGIDVVTGNWYVPGGWTLEASINRLLGPLEFPVLNFPGPTEVADSALRYVATSCFGIDANGNVYFDTNGPDEGQNAELFLDTQNLALIFDTEGEV